ncbi:MAG: M50 family metallopeptidase [Bryobacteraceae bacterium]
MSPGTANLRPTRRSPGTIGHISMFGVPVRFHFTFLFLIALIAVASSASEASWAVDSLFLIGLFASVLFHELGHALTARHLGIRTLEIVLYPVGGVSRMQRQGTPREEIRIAVAGPLVNLALGAGLLALPKWTDPAAQDLVRRLAEANLYLGAFNLVPAFPLDGGRLLRAFLARNRPEESATLTVARIGRILAVPLGLFGIWQGEMLLMILAFMLYLAGYQEASASSGRGMLHGVPVSAAMVTDFQTLSHGSTLREAAALVLASAQQDFPVVHGDSVVGLLHRGAFVRGILDSGADSYVANAMDRHFLRLAPSTELSAAVVQLAETGSCAVVMEGERILGLLTAENVSEFVLLRRLGVSPVSPQPRV